MFKLQDPYQTVEERLGSSHRQLINEGHAAFHDISNALELNDWQTNLPYCRDYINKYLAITQSLSTDNGSNIVLSSVISAFKNLFLSSEATNGSGSIVACLVAWMRDSFSFVLEDATKPGFDDSKDWVKIKLLILMGETQEAAKRIRYYPNTQGHIRRLANFVAALPFPTIGNFNTSELRRQREQWKSDSFETQNLEMPIDNLMRFLLGDLAAIQEFVNTAPSLFGDGSYPSSLSELNFMIGFSAQLILSHPDVTFAQVQSATHDHTAQNPLDISRAAEIYVNSTYATFKGASIGRIFYYCVDQNATAAVGDLSKVCGTWTATHICDLLHRSGWLDDDTGRRQSTIQSYCDFLMPDDNDNCIHWQTAFTYFKSIDKVSEFAERLSDYICGLTPSWSRTFHKAIALLVSNDLHHEAQELRSRLGVQALRNKQLCLALSWFLQCDDQPNIAKVVEEVLREFIETQDFDSQQIVDNFRAAKLQSPRLAFLIEYDMFRKNLSQGHLKEAGIIIVKLISDQTMTPSWFRFQMLLDCLGLLENSEIILDAQQTKQLMIQLERCCASFRRSYYVESVTAKLGVESDEYLIEPLRLALCRNLARSVIAGSSR